MANIVLRIANRFKQLVTPSQAKQLNKIVGEFMQAYADHRDEPINVWLGAEIQRQLPEKSAQEVEEMTTEIIATVELNQKERDSLLEAIRQGRSQEAWFAGQIEKATADLNPEQKAEYMLDLNAAVDQANSEKIDLVMLEQSSVAGNLGTEPVAVYGQAIDNQVAMSNAAYSEKPFVTNGGLVNQNPNLDGFIAEQHHVSTFNQNAVAAGSEYRAEVVAPDPSSGYSKNGVDVVIKNSVGKIVKRFQLKYGADADATLRLFDKGDYRGQQKLGPSEQLGDLEARHPKATDVLESPDGIKSNPLPKFDAKALQKQAQSGNFDNIHSWNDVEYRHLAKGIGVNVAQGAAYSAAIGVPLFLAQKALNGEEIKTQEVVQVALETGADAAVKAGLAGALKVAAEKGILTILKGTPLRIIANIACCVVENVKVAWRVAKGELTVTEGLNEMEVTTVSTAASLALAAVGGAKLGAAMGTVFGPIGTVVGGIAGSIIGGIAGSKIGRAVSQGFQKLREGAVKVVQHAWEGVKNFAQGAWNWLTGNNKQKAKN